LTFHLTFLMIFSCVTRKCRNIITKYGVQHLPQMFSWLLVMMIYDIFVNCSWVASRWQQYSTHLRRNNTQNNKKQTTYRTTQKFLEESWPCPIFVGFTLAFALQLRKNHGKTSVRVAEECQLAR
jgi:hypothetical protein